MLEKKFIKDLADKEQFTTVFLVSDKQLLTDKNGRDYLSLSLSDKTGTLNGRMWDNASDVVDTFSSGDFVQVKGHVQLYQNRKQIVIHGLKTVEAESIDVKDFLASSLRDVDEMYSELLEVIESLSNLHLKRLLQAVVKDKDKAQLIKNAAAAKTIHHAYVGGLMEHILSICKSMDFLASHYQFLNRDLLIFGAIFHDIGKIYELQVGNGISYTTKGRLVGHITIACELIDKEVSQIEGFPDKLKDMCKHIVLSHHGRLEFGSPKRPKFLEAMIVSMIDELDSRVAAIKSFMDDERADANDWTRYSNQYERYFFLDTEI